MNNIRKYLKVSIVFIVCVILFSQITVEAEVVDRISGGNRYETALAISKHFEGADTIILATGKDFPDALSAIPLAKKYDAPIILTDGVKLTDNIMAELIRLEAKKVFIIGGKTIISDNIEKDLQAKGLEVERVFGNDRYETSLSIANLIGFENGVFVATGKNFADALSIGPIAGNLQMPIILTAKEKMSEGVEKLLKDNKVNKAYIIGGNGVIADSVAGKFTNYERISGANRYATNSAIVNKFKDKIDMTKVYVATGLNFPDALAGGALVAKNSGIIVLTNNILEEETKNTIKTNNITDFTFLGGEGVVSSVIRDALMGRSGWFQYEGSKYYINENSVIATGWTKISDKLYYFYNNGKMAVNTVVDGYNIDANGVRANESIRIQNAKKAVAAYVGSDNVGVFAMDIKTGETFSINGDKKYQTASTAKLSSVLYAQKRVNEGTLKLTQSFKYYDWVNDVKGAYQRGGTGLLQYRLYEGQPVTLKTLIEYTCSYSDNLGANLLAYYGADNNDAKFRAYMKSILGREIINYDRNLSPKDLVLLMKEIYKQGGLALESLKHTSWDDVKIPKYIDVPVAHKIGIHDEANNDIAIVYANQPYILAIMTPAYSDEYISKLSKVIYDKLK